MSMESVHLRESAFVYFKQLVRAGLDGIDSARNERDGRVFTPPLQTVVWTPTAIVATIGMLSAHLIGKRKSVSRVALGGLAGSVLGFGAALAWASRDFIGPAARTAVRRVDAVRDAHWLESHPIDYA
jgi:hypothetical protein